MSAKIVITSQPPYTGGTLLTGHLLIQPKKDASLSYLTITLSGTTSSRIFRRYPLVNLTYTSSQHLFSLAQVIPLNDTSLPPNQPHTFPFSFMLPRRAAGNYGDVDPNKSSEFASQWGHDLPPPFRYEKFVSWDDAEGAIVYMLSAHAEKSKHVGLLSGNYSFSNVELEYAPVRNVEVVDPGWEVERRGFGKEGLGGGEVKWHVPRFGVPGQALALGVQVDGSGGEGVRVESLQVVLQKRRAMRAGKKSSHGTKSETILNWKAGQREGVLGEGKVRMVGDFVTGGAVIPAETMANFACFNMAVPSYGMTITYGLVVGEKRIQGKIVRETFTVVPRYFVPEQ